MARAPPLLLSVEERPAAAVGILVAKSTTGIRPAYVRSHASEPRFVGLFIDVCNKGPLTMKVVDRL
jgi:hypothetical protein